MSDLFHDAVPEEFIHRVFSVMAETPQHTYQVLTKRADRLEEVGARIEWPTNIWMGVSVENEDYWWRVDHLRRVKAHIRFLSLEPLLGPLTAPDFQAIHWVIAGGESGPQARPVRPEWLRCIRDACISQGVAFHFKQWGGPNKKATGRILDQRTWDEMPRRSSEAAQLPVGAQLGVSSYDCGWWPTENALGARGNLRHPVLDDAVYDTSRLNDGRP